VSGLKPNGSQRVPWRRRLAIALAVGVLALLASAWIAGSLLVHPTNHIVSKPYGFSAAPVSIAGRGHAIAGWWADGGSNTPVVLLLHGVRDDRTTMVPRAQLLGKHGFSVLLIDLQGHGETPGEAITFGARESADVTAALGWIKQNTPGRRVGVIGCSLGGASVLLAPQPTGFDAIVLEAVYPRITRAVENRVHLFVGPLTPVLAPLLLMQLEPRLHLSTSDLEPIKSISRLGAPVLVVAGSSDRHTTLAESRELYDAAASPKQFWVVQGAGHQDFMAFDARGYEDHVLEFMMDNLKVDAQ
jgi:fermentation-respiration switch protein FrsA (DUF1100 family)